MPLPLSLEIRTRIVSALTEGNSIRATARMVGVNRETVQALGLRVGDGCAAVLNRIVRGVAAHVIECNELWGWIHTKEARVRPTDPGEWGDAYTYLALDATSRLVISWLLGKRDDAHTRAFITDLRARLTVIPHVSTDGWVPYIDAMREAFKGAVDFGQVVKNYRKGAQRGPDHRYEPPRDPFITRTAVSGAPDVDRLSTSHVERLNGTMRHMVGRKRRLCLAFSKTLRGHRAAVALAVRAYNLVRIHATLETTPAVAAGLVPRPWTVAELVEAALSEAESEAPIAVPLVPRPGALAARQTSTGSVLRLVHGGSAAAPAAPSAPLTEAPIAPAGPVQLGLFDWRPPRPWRPMEQLSLFPEDAV